VEVEVEEDSWILMWSEGEGVDAVVDMERAAYVGGTNGYTTTPTQLH
jgi:hypothetical protein